MQTKEIGFTKFEKKPEAPALTNTEILCFVLGWQGGTIHQVALALSPSKSLISSIFKMQERILTGTPDEMRELCRLAQRARD